MTPTHFSIGGIYDVQLHELAMREQEARNNRSRPTRHIGFIHGLKKAIEQNVPHPMPPSRSRKRE